jgi:hypothetical protein
MCRKAIFSICPFALLLAGLCVLMELFLSVRLNAAEPTQVPGKPQKGTPQPMATACGPRCVQYLLRSYGQEEDLTRLIRETQWSNVNGAASLSSLDHALRARGINTYAMQVPAGTRLRWPFPVLIYSCGGRGEGHFSVWVPDSSTDRARIWDGLSGLGAKPVNCLPPECLGAILLTANSPITHPENVIAPPPMLARWAVYLLAVLPVVVLAIELSRFKLAFFVNPRNLIRR